MRFPSGAPSSKACNITEHDGRGRKEISNGPAGGNGTFHEAFLGIGFGVMIILWDNRLRDGISCTVETILDALGKERGHNRRGFDG